MALSDNQQQQIKAVLKNAIHKKFQKYKPETSYMPFHTSLLGKDRLALFSFIQSLNTTFGTSIFEPVALVLAKKKFKETKSQAVAGIYISSEAQLTIQNIIDSLITAEKAPNKLEEIELIRKVCQKGTIKKVKPTKVDVWLQDFEEGYWLFDLKTAKPNIGNFKEYKRMLLEWVAVMLYQNPSIKINTLISIPYNPYYPKKYKRWTIRGMLDLKQELKVAEEFWDFLGGQGTFQELLDCFETVGKELRVEIDEYFEKFKK